MTKMKPLPVMATNCGTCPFVEGSLHADLAEYLAASAETQSRICHCTGTNAIGGRTGKKERLCRGARDLQLQRFAAMGFIAAPTDEAWAAKVAEMNEGRS